MKLRVWRGAWPMNDGREILGARAAFRRLSHRSDDGRKLSSMSAVAPHHSDAKLSPNAIAFRPGMRSEIRTPLFADMLDWWRTKRGSRRMPARADFLPEDLARWWRHLVLLRIERTGVGGRDRYKFVYHGLKPIDYDGGDFTGRYLDEALPARMYALAEAVYREACERRVPLYTLRHVTGQSGFPVIYERLLMPLSADGARVDLLLSLLERHSTEDLKPRHLDGAGTTFEVANLVAIAFD